MTGDMTLLVSISANTAAIAIEALKPGRRISPKDQAADIKADAERNAQRAQNAGDPGDVEAMIPATTVSLDFLDAGQQPRQQMTINQVQSAYRDLED
ncbi:hypothetical protein ACFFP0_30695 [Rhizobium puerariae]|uniref:Uncharacterized protein n=1 Tax=Rhizobium puerariae TaxID=1585791 RepID=A0ABV6ATT6_9HYPH